MRSTMRRPFWKPVWRLSFSAAWCAAVLASEGGQAVAQAPPDPPAPTTPTASGEDAAPNIEDLDLLSLLNADVTVATKKKESVSDVPASVSVFDARTIRQMGMYTIADLADYTAGYSSYTIYGERVLETRGQKAGSFNNNKHLLLLDGIPINHAKAYKAHTEYELPLLFADRVEFLKGPASALYGTGAFFGVVNVMPKALTEDGVRLDGRVSLATADLDTRAMSNAVYRGDGLQVEVNVGYYTKRASRQFVGSTNSPLNQMQDDQDSLFLRSAVTITDPGWAQGISAGVVYLDKTGGLGEHWMHGQFSHPINQIRWTTFIPYIRWRRALSEHWEVDSYLKYNISREQGYWAPFSAESFAAYDGTGSVFSAYDQFVHNVEGQAQATYTPMDGLSFIAGANVDTRQMLGEDRQGMLYNVSADPGAPYISEGLTDSPRITTTSGFLQARLDLPVLAGLSLIAGVRADGSFANGESFAQISPRVGVVQKIFDAWNLKVLYGNALRAPGIKEYGLNDETRRVLAATSQDTSGIPNLKAETIQSLEVATNVVTDYVGVSLTGFFNRTNNALDGQRYLDQNIFANASSHIDAWGFEAEVKAKLHSNALLFANYAWAKAQDKDGLFLNDVPSHKVNAGLTLTYNPGPVDLQLTPLVRWVHSYRTADVTIPDTPGLLALDVNAGAQLTNGLIFEVQGRNLTADDFKYPKDGVADVPTAQRTVFFTLGFAR
jgi:outer membrane receptor for ferrienterochelin and colicins